MKRVLQKQTIIERLITWVGSPSSLAVHTAIFILSFVLAAEDLISWNRMFLVLTTAVSLEAIYLAIFIQMSVNKQTISLREVEEDVEDIQEELQEDEEREQKEVVLLDSLTKDIHRILIDIESLKKPK